jgi:o-succinylbenzoate synthase
VEVSPGLTAPELLSGLHVVALPLAVRFRGVDVREVALLRGPAGWGEFAPFLEYDDAESSRWLAAAIEAAYAGFPPALRTEVPVNATVPAVPAGRVASVLARYDGCTTVKVKVAERGQSLADDLSRVAAVRDVLGPAGLIRVDANGAWSVDEAVDGLSRLAAYDLEYAEQPCASVEDLARVRVSLARAGVDVLVAADESIRKASDPLRVARLRAADLIVVKVAPLGGVRSALRIVGEVGLPAVVSSALDSSVGMRAGVALAASLLSLEHACGLGTIELMTGDVTPDRLVPVGGRIAVRDVTADPELLARYAVPPDRLDWWRERVRRCVDLLGSA